MKKKAKEIKPKAGSHYSFVKNDIDFTWSPISEPLKAINEQKSNPERLMVYWILHSELNDRLKLELIRTLYGL